MMPDGWIDKPLGERFKLASGTARPADVMPAATETHRVPIYGGNGILGYTREKNWLRDAIVIGRVGEKCGVTRHVAGPTWISDNALYSREIAPDTDIRFLTYRLQLFDLSRLRKKGGQPLVTQQPIYALRLPFPPLSEQKKIAAILSTWDRAIETAEKLLANAEAHKLSLMQQLLTAKRRLKGFEGREWKVKSLRQLGSFRKGSGLPKTEVGPSGRYPCVLYGELYTTYDEVIDQPVSYTDLDEGTESIAGDVLIPASTTTTGIDLAIASCIVLSGVRLGGDINVFRRSASEIEGTFLAYYLTHIRRREMARYAQGITIVHLKGSDLLDIVVQVPPVEEQRRILDVVNLAEAEISTLKQHLEKLRDEKSGLMQQLLTGKRRVTV